LCADGRSNFDFIRYRPPRRGRLPLAFDLLHIGVEDLRRDPLEVRKATLESLLSSVGPGIRYNEHIEGDAEDIFRHVCKLKLIFRHVCKLKLEGIVSKLRRSSYSSGRSPHWIKIKNPDCDAVRREAEEDWRARPMRVRR
jgi:bifunctional non-homologous end joining protein LigD